MARRPAAARLARSPVAGRAAARTAPSYPISMSSTRRSVRSASVAAAAAKPRRASSERPASSSRRSCNGAPAWPVPAAGASTVSMPCPAGSPNSACRSAMPPARIISRSGRRVATAATRAASSPIALRSSAAGGSLAPTMIASVAPSSSNCVIASGSVVWALAETVRQPLRAAAATSGPSVRSVAATIPSVRAGSDRTSKRTRSCACRPSRPRRSTIVGSARAIRSSRMAIAVSGPSTLGRAIDPTSRQARPSLPTMDTETVAAPISTAAKARGSLVTEACYPATPLSAEARSVPVRRPRSSRRRSPRAA